jgi:putative (di)nucleoside polyphosphate hydrolase
MTPEEISLLPYRPCVGIVLINKEKNIFGGQRIDSKTNAWQMPQGGIDDGERPLNAAFRELEEETGIEKPATSYIDKMDKLIPYDLPVELIPKLWKGRYRGQMQQWFLFEFLQNDNLINIKTEHPEFSRWKWMTKEEMLKNIVPFKLNTYQTVFQYFDKHLNS